MSLSRHPGLSGTVTILAPAPSTSRAAVAARGGRGLRELGVIAVLYLAYAASRVFADDSLAPARARAARILDLEGTVRLDFERDVVGWFVDHDVAGLLVAYYYASAHYLLTAAVLVWLFRRRTELYPHARRALVGGTLLALFAYLLMPTAPPRLMAYADLMALHAESGWWGEAASAPQGLGWMTNQLAAFPSMHAGWSLWVALVVAAATTNRMLRAAGWAHAGVTAVVVVGTGNHWLLDVVVGWAVVVLAWRTVSPTAGEQTVLTPRERDLAGGVSLTEV